MKVISIANNKGGVCKTTLTFNLAYLFANYHKKRVLMIDIDHQADLSLVALGNDYYNIEEGYTIEKAFKEDMKNVDISEIMYSTKWNMEIIPSDIALNGKEYNLMYKPNIAMDRIKILLQQARIYDYVFIDCPPSLNAFTQNAIKASDYYIIPAELNRQSQKAINFTVEMALETNKEAKLLKIVPVKADLRTSIQKSYFDIYKQEYGDLLEQQDYIGVSTGFIEAMSLRVPFVMREPSHKNTTALKRLSHKLIKQIEGE